MVKNVFLLILVLVSCQRQTPIEKFNDDIIQLVKSNSLYSDSIDWSLIKTHIGTISKNVSYSDQCSTSVMLILSQLRILGDNHSFYVSKKIMNRLTRQSKGNYQPVAKHIDKNTVYIKIPRFSSINDSVNNVFATKIQNLIREMDSDSITGWIVDLRENSGGSLYPMLAGLGPLIGEGVLGYFIDRNGIKTPWTYFNGEARENIPNKKSSKKSNQIESSVFNNEEGRAYVKNYYYIKNKNSKIAVLIGAKTSSSGEMTAISFKGKNNIKTFGHTTSGHTTANTAFKLLNNSFLLLATGNAADRNGRVYFGGITPDIEVKDYYSDNCISAAKKWLMENN